MNHVPQHRLGWTLATLTAVGVIGTLAVSGLSFASTPTTSTTVTAAAQGPKHGPKGGPGRGGAVLATVEGTSNGVTDLKTPSGNQLELKLSTTFHTGDLVEVRLAHDGSVVGIRAVLPSVAGTVQSYQNGVLTMTTTAGSKQVAVSSQTVIHQGPTAATSAALTAGMHVRAEGTLGSNGVLTATNIDVQLPHLRGVITALGSGSLTIKEEDGTTATVTTTSTTRIDFGKRAASTQLAVGQYVDISGEGSGSTFQALTIHVRPAPPAAPATTSTSSGS